MGWGELSREEMGETDRSRGNPQRQRQNTEGERVKEIKRETEAEQEADEREETGGRLWVCGHCHALLIFSIFLTGPGQRFTRVYLTHLQHEADKIHIAFVFGSSPELLMETQTGQGPAAAGRLREGGRMLPAGGLRGAGRTGDRDNTGRLPRREGCGDGRDARAGL